MKSRVILIQVGGTLPVRGRQKKGQNTGGVKEEDQKKRQTISARNTRQAKDTEANHAIPQILGRRQRQEV